jgi:hypothetical protein
MAADDRPPRSAAPGSPRPALDPDLAAVASSLHQQYDANLGPQRVDTEIRLVADRFSTAKIRAFVPLFVRRYAGANLRGQTRK